MRVRAGVLREPGHDFEVMELELDPPGPGEVLVRMAYSGLCHSDHHCKFNPHLPLPWVMGHEGAGVVVDVGEGSMRVAPGDHIVCSFIPVCGRCRWCAAGHSNLCEASAEVTTGRMPDGTYRFHDGNVGFGSMSTIGSFAEYSVLPEAACVKIDQEVPLDAAALLSCAVPTGWGSAVYTAGVTPGDVVAVLGCGGVGVNAVQGAAMAGASIVAVIDPFELRRDFARTLGATHAFADADSAMDGIQHETSGAGADSAIVAAGIVDEQAVNAAFEMVRRGGTVVIAGFHDDHMTKNVVLAGGMVALDEKRIVGSFYGSCNPHYDIPNLARLYKRGLLKLDELITSRYALDDLEKGFHDMMAGRNIRGLLVHAQ